MKMMSLFLDHKYTVVKIFVKIHLVVFTQSC